MTDGQTVCDANGGYTTRAAGEGSCGVSPKGIDYSAWLNKKFKVDMDRLTIELKVRSRLF